MNSTAFRACRGTLRRSLAALLVAVAAECLHAADAKNPIQATDGWIRVVPGDLPCAGYLTLENTSSADVALTSVTLPDFERVQIHESYTTATGDAGMRMLAQLVIGGHRIVRFAPGSFHLMLLHRRQPLTIGSVVTAELHFASGPPLRVPLRLRPADYDPSAADPSARR